MTERPLLMIPGPIEISSAVQQALKAPPVSHVSPELIEAFGGCLEKMRQVWRSGQKAQPFIVAGSGTLAMEMAVANVVDGTDRVLVVNTGYFSDRIALMAAQRGAKVTSVSAPVGDAPSVGEVEEALQASGATVMLCTHVDTSTGVRVDAAGYAKAARAQGALSVFDGVCATAGERFEMEAWGADVYLTASQKAVGLPPGLALLVASERAMERASALQTPPPLAIDFAQWTPIMRAYEARQPSYFATPAVTLVSALSVALNEILAGAGVSETVQRHQARADALRGCWRALGLQTVPVREALCANTLSALRYPSGTDASLVAAIAARGVIVAGGLHPAIKSEYFRVGHMGDVLNHPTKLVRTVDAIAGALADKGVPVDDDALAAAKKAIAP